MNLSDLRSKLSKNVAFRRAYDEIGDAISMGFHFRAARLAAKLTQAQLATVLKIRPSDISHLEAGSPKVPGWIWKEVAKRLEEQLTARGVDVRPFLRFENRPEEEPKVATPERGEAKISHRGGNRRIAPHVHERGRTPAPSAPQVDL